ncbi:putative NADP-dependent alcohol dehydrogenase C 2 [Glarea lozoyensis 74030]|uniref:Putative NADP-dependent alcohol dehydrogenase C 2 n=1 Tax=Glarea lozoyensis (strain ATCC 74030 / MF5533) TaxID=1104152 RepID=H0EIK0_GLAL7|nr:putative NADP-dependent alcohol dehydrogenase C 2 [Glarea lozoyensis 74030]
MATVYRGVDGAGKASPLSIPDVLGPKQILLKITHASLCGTDVHFLTSGIALGHEGVGIVEKIGSEVTQFKVGDRAGAGYVRNGKMCGAMSEALMERKIIIRAHSVLTFPDIGNETFLHRIPDSLASEHAAPLQCAGATVYTAITSVAKPGDRVGILGIGGLGHLAIQFASKLGYETVVFSSSARKEEEARGFGASEFVVLGEAEKVSAPVDVLIVAGSKYPDWEKFMQKNILARTGTIVPLSAPAENFNLPSTPMFFNGYNLHSSLVAHRHVHDEMLAFAAAQGVKPAIETFAFSEEGFAEAYQKLKEGGMRYRGVLVR